MQGTISLIEGAEISERDTVENRQINRDRLTIAPGTEIIWINRDSESYTLASDKPQKGDAGY